MNPLKKAALITAAISLMFFAACGGDNTPPIPPTPPVPTYSVSFNANGGTSVMTHSVKQGESITASPATTRTGYDFAGWYAASDFSGSAVTFPYAVTGNTTLYARWTQQMHTVMFYSNGVSSVNVPHGSGIGSDNMPPNPAPQIGYDFAGWNTSQSAATANFYSSTPVMSDMTVYAIWTIRTYTVTFDSNGGNNVPSVEVPHGNTASAPAAAPTRNGYNFGGWYTDAELTIPASFPVAVTYSVSFYAKWTANIPVSSITLNLPTLNMEAGTERTLTANVLPANAVNREVTWESDNPAVANVDENGVVEAYKQGTARIYVTAEGGVQTYCEVTVTPDTSGVSPYTVDKYVIDSNADNNINDRIKYSFTYDDYDFYYIYLGEMTNIPIAYQISYNHKGDAINYRFSYTETNETTIRNTVSRNSEEARTVAEENSKSVGGSVGLTISESIKASYLELLSAKIEITASAEAKWEQYRKTNSEFRETKSLTNTTESATTFIRTTTNEYIKDFSSADRNGYYRWTLFQPSNVYLYVVRERATGKIKFEFREYVIPNAYFWSLDYSEFASFRKSDDTNFEFNVSLLSNLPTPTLGPGMIIFDLNGGSGATPASLKGPAKLPAAPPRTGYVFDGWNTAPNGTGATYQTGDVYDPTFKESAILYAQWVVAAPVSYTVTFSINGGLGTIPASITNTAGSVITLPGNTGGFYRNNYMFVGWNTNAAGTGTTRNPGYSFTVTGNTTLYAKWIANPTAYKTIRTGTYTIDDGGDENHKLKPGHVWEEADVYNQSYDTVQFSTFDNIDLETMKQQGYTKINFYIKLNVRELADAGIWVFLYRSDLPADSHKLGSVKFNHGTSGQTKTEWEVHDVKFENIPIEKFTSINTNKFFIRYAASGQSKDIWENKDLQIQLLFLK